MKGKVLSLLMATTMVIGLLAKQHRQRMIPRLLKQKLPEMIRQKRKQKLVRNLIQRLRQLPEKRLQ